MNFVCFCRCSGRRECDIRIPDAELDATKPCFKELKTYLDVSYLCVPGNHSLSMFWVFIKIMEWSPEIGGSFPHNVIPEFLEAQSAKFVKQNA